MGADPFARQSTFDEYDFAVCFVGYAFGFKVERLHQEPVILGVRGAGGKMQLGIRQRAGRLGVGVRGGVVHGSWG